MKYFSKKPKPIAEKLDENVTEDKLNKTLRTWLKENYDFHVTDSLLKDFVTAYKIGSTVKVCLWDTEKQTYLYMKIVKEYRRKQTDSHFLYFIIGKKPTGTKWEPVVKPEKEDIYHFNPISHQINVARQMMREQVNETYSAYTAI